MQDPNVTSIVEIYSADKPTQHINIKAIHHLERTLSQVRRELQGLQQTLTTTHLMEEHVSSNYLRIPIYLKTQEPSLHKSITQFSITIDKALSEMTAIGVLVPQGIDPKTKTRKSNKG